MTETISTRKRGRRLAGMLAGALALGVLPLALPASAQTTALPPARDIRLNACPVDDGADNQLGTADDTTEVPEDGFTDVAQGATHEFSIDCIVWYEVASGTSATTYNPGGNVKREQMATFIAQLIDYAAANGEGTVLPPAGTGNQFPCDVTAGSTHFANIQRLAAADIVQGTGTNTRGACFDPGGPVSRAQMATFIKAAQEYITGIDQAPIAADYFADDEGNTHENNINIIASEGIVRGTGINSNNEAVYNPGGDVKRDQMGTFLANKLDVLVEDGVTTPPPVVSVTVSDRTPDQGASINVTVTSVRDTIATVDVSGCGVPTATAPVANDTADMDQVVPITIPATQAVADCDLTVETKLTGGSTLTSVQELTIEAM